jgi:hypothetical protein
VAASTEGRSLVKDPRFESIYAPAPAGVKPLRVGIILGNFIQPRWVTWLFDGIVASGTAEIVCLVRYDIRKLATKASNVLPAGAWSQGAYALYSYVDGALARRSLSQSDPASLIDVSPWFAEIKVLHKHAIKRSDDCLLMDSDPADVRHEALDVALALDSDTWTGEILSAARFGVWAYSWCDRSRCSGDAGLFWAVSDAHPMMSCGLTMLRESPVASRVIARFEVPVHPRSLPLTRRKAYAGAVSTALRCLRQFQLYEVEGAPERTLETVPQSSEPETSRCSPPTNAQVFLFLLKLALRWLRFRWLYRHGEWWFLALRRRPLASVAEAGESDRLKGFVPLPAVPGHSYADPFLLEERGAVHLFFEDLDKSCGKGVISHSRLATDGTLTRPMPVLERPYHLSYPFIFQWDGQIFMLPESGHNRTIELYRCRDFPDCWTLDRVLLEGWRATDATLHQSDDGRWWMFAAVDELGEGCPALFLFKAATPLGPWYPHPHNPIQTDPRHTRPAGRLFRRAGRLLRPAQDASLRYGGAVWLMEVLELTEEDYRERPFIRIGPEWLDGNLCLHHLDANDRFEVIDGMKLRPAETWCP